MSLYDKLFNQIKQLSTNITEENYCAYHEQGYDILIKIKGLGIEQEQAFKLLLKYHNSLEDGLSKGVDCRSARLYMRVVWSAQIHLGK